MISRIHEPSMDCEIISTALVLNVATGVISRMHEQSMDCEIIKTNRICMAIRLTAVNSCLPPCLGACPTGKAAGEVPPGPKRLLEQKMSLQAVRVVVSPVGLICGSVLCLP